MTRIRIIALFLIIALLLQAGAVSGLSLKAYAAAGTGPIPQSQSPLPGTIITPDRALKVTFDENVRRGAGNVTLDPGPSGTVISYDIMDATHVQWDSLKTIIIQSNQLVSGLTYTVSIDAGAVIGDTSKTANTQPFIVGTFTVRSLDVSASSPFFPVNNATAVNADASITLKLQFNQPNMKIGSGNLYVKKDSDNTIAQTINVNSIAASQFSSTSAGTMVSIPIARLANTTKYYIMIDPGAFLDGYNNPYAGINDRTVWTFTTEDLFDVIPPTASGFAFVSSGNADPTTGQMNGNLSFAFSESVYAGTGSIDLQYANGTSFCSIPVNSGAVTIDPTTRKTVTISPNAYSCPKFINGTSYRLVIGNQTFKDATGNYYAGNSGWTFSSIVDNTAPAVVLYSPTPASTAIPVSTTQFSLSFNEAIKQVGTGPMTATAFAQNNPSLQASFNVTLDTTDNKKLILTRTAASTDFNPNTVYVINIPSGLISDAAGNVYPGILNVYQWTFTTGAAGGVPSVTKAEMDSSSVLLTFSDNLNAANQPYAVNFYVTVNGAFSQVTAVSVSGTQARLTLQSGVLVGQIVKVSYSPQPGDASRHLQNLSGKEVAAFANLDVINNGDTTIPRPISGSVNGYNVTINFNKQLASIASTAYSQFYVSWNGTSVTPTSAALNGSSLVLVLPNTLANTSSAVTVTYIPGAAALKDIVGNSVASFSNFAVVNSNDAVAPVFSSATAIANKVYLYYNEALRTSPTPSTASFSILVNGSGVPLSSVSVSGTTVELTLAQTLVNGQTVTLTYSPISGGIADLAGNLAPSISGFSVAAGGSGVSRLLSATVNGSALTLNYSAALDSTASSMPSVSQYAVKVNGLSVGVAQVTVTGSQVNLILQSYISATQQITVSYYKSSITLKDLLGQQVDSFTDFAATSQTGATTGPLPDYLESDGSGGVRMVNSKVTTITSSQTPSGIAANKYSVDGDKLYAGFNALKQSGSGLASLVVQVPDSEPAAIVSLPVSALISSSSVFSNGVVKVAYGSMTYSLPLKVINYPQQLLGTGLDTSTAKVVIRIERSYSNPLVTAMKSQGGQIIGYSADFSVALSPANGSVSSEKAITDFDTYVERSIAVDAAGTDSKLLNVVRLDEESGSVEYVPTRIVSQGSKFVVTFKRKGNSIYAVIRKPSVVFPDMNTHWAKSDVSLLASKYIVKGTTSGQFKPQTAITRADFAEYVARGLGLTGDRTAASKFSDISKTNASAAFIGAASKAGIIAGDTDGKFRPNASIKREEMAAMLVRAMKYAGVTKSASTTALNKFSDRTKVSSFAKDGLAVCVQVGIISGVTSTALKPQDNATRAEAAIMLKRFLVYADLLQVS